MFIEIQQQTFWLKLWLILLGWAENIRYSSNSWRFTWGFPQSYSKEQVGKKNPKLKPSLFWDVTKKRKDLLCPAEEPVPNLKFHDALDASNSKPEIFISKFHRKCSRHYVDTILPPSSSKDPTPVLPSARTHSTCTPQSLYLPNFQMLCLQENLYQKDWLALTRDIQSRKYSTNPYSLYPPPPLRYKYAVSHYTTARSFIFFLFLSLSLRLSSSFNLEAPLFLYIRTGVSLLSRERFLYI